jgi:DNA-binding CsgD family transcriptional regulator
MSSQLSEFSHKLAAVLPQVGTEHLPHALISMIKGLVPTDNAVIIHYCRGQKPNLRYNDYPSEDRQTLIQKFIQGAFLLDPFYRNGKDGKVSGLFRLDDLAPEGFHETEYYRSYFKHTELKDEIGYIIHLNGNQFINISLGQQNDISDYKQAHIALLKAITPVIEQVCKLHFIDPEKSIDNQLPDQLESALNHFGTAYLTDRESQVVQLFLHGHSTKSIAERLGISPETVKLHRKNSYAKLDISSQAELFHLFIDSLASLTNYSGGDPLVGYL